MGMDATLEKVREIAKNMPACFHDAAPSKLVQTEFIISVLASKANTVLRLKLRCITPAMAIERTTSECYYSLNVRLLQYLKIEQERAKYERNNKSLCTDGDNAIDRAARALKLEEKAAVLRTYCLPTNTLTIVSKPPSQCKEKSRRLRMPSYL